MQRNSAMPQSQSTANACWGTEVGLVASSSNPFLNGSRPVHGSQLLVPDQLYRNGEGDANEPEVPVLRASSGSKPRLSLVDDKKMKELLSLLRSNEFCGRIDPTVHAPYLEAPRMEGAKKPDKVKELSLRSLLRNRRSLQSGLNAPGSMSHFKEALKKARSYPSGSP